MAISVAQFPLGPVQHELDDGHGRNRRQVVRIEDAEHRVGEFGEVVVELVADAGVQKGEGLDQPFHVRVFGRVRRQPQPSGDLRVGLGEFRAQPAEKGQFAIVVGQQFVAHRAVPLTSISPVAGSNEESKTTSSKAGSA